MNEETAFLEAIGANPKDLSLRLVYADWLEERGDARSEYLRVDAKFRELFDSLGPKQLANDPTLRHLRAQLTKLGKALDSAWVALIDAERPKLPMNKTTKTRMFSAIQNKDLTALYAILDDNPDAMETVGEHNRNVRDKTPLMFAIQCANFRLAHALLDRGAKASAVMAGGPRSSVLALVCHFAYCDAPKHDEWLRLATRLLDEGADPTSGLWPALHGFGGLVNRVDLIRLLLDRGANPDQMVGNSGNTARELVEINRHLYSDEVLGLFGLKNTRALPKQ
jgi:uncharacterized protein (TIGR02996 family)